jgi:alpha-amylase
VSRFLSEAPAGLDGDELSRRYAVALVALFTLPGIPQLYQGDELAMLGGYGAQRRDMPPWAWQASTRPGAHPGYAGDAQATFALVQSLARLRAGDEALWRGSYVEVTRARAGANVMAFCRSTAPDDGDLVVLDGDASPLTVTLRPAGTAWPDGTVLRDALGIGAPAVVTVEHGAVTIALPPRTAAVYRAERGRR